MNENSKVNKFFEKKNSIEEEEMSFACEHIEDEPPINVRSLI